MSERGDDRRVQTICLLILTALAVAGALRFLQPVLVPFVLALFISIGLTPLVDFQVRRLRLPHVLAVVTTLMVGFAVLFALGLLVSISVGQLADSADDYQRSTQTLLRDAVEALPLARMGIESDQALRELWNVPAETVGSLLLRTGNAVLGLISDGVLVLIFMCFLLFGGTTRSGPVGGVWGEIESGTRRYILVKLLLSAVTGTLIGGTLGVLGVQLALVFGLLAFLLNFIPSIGSFVAVLLPLPVVLLDPNTSTTTVILALAIPGVIQFTVGNVIEPRMMGQSFDLHPITVMLALIFWGVLWGVVGMFLATPITAVMKSLLQKSELTAPVAHLMAGRLAPRPDRPEPADDPAVTP